NTQLEEKVALLEGAEACMSTASGIGAISSALWTALKAGDHVVASKTLYGCTFALLNHGLTRYGVEVTFVDATNLDEIKAAMKENTRVVYLETPGFVVGKKEFIDQVRLFGVKDMTGAVLSPFDAYLILRGMKTLQIRMDKHSKNALEVAKFLEGHKNVVKVNYPGLESFPQRELAKKQMDLP
ncbi:PLP-dependent transferase, partial [Paraclostridium sordellii]|uniref:PLP-dependent transferase n=1 Tax=Paraclostridium sordellii TaxID=1505 RepID=UPI0022E6F7B3